MFIVACNERAIQKLAFAVSREIYSFNDLNNDECNIINEICKLNDYKIFWSDEIKNIPIIEIDKLHIIKQ